MTDPIVRDALGHHTWATARLLEACAELSDEGLATNVPGTYGSVIDTLRHLVTSDAWYVALLTGEPDPVHLDGAEQSVAELRELAADNERRWAAFFDTDPDSSRVVIRHRDEGVESHAPLSIRIAQMLHHGTDHRSQVCTALTTLGIEPPEIDVWAYGRLDGRVWATDDPPA